MTDRELAYDVACRGSQKAFAEIVRRYSGQVFSRALGVVHSEEEAAEVTQQTFVRAYESIDSWRGTELGPWLLAIAVHTALKLLDKERRRRSISMENLSASAFGHITTEDNYAAEREERLQLMEKAIQTLAPLDQQLLRLHYYEQQLTADIAHTLGLTQSNVLVKLHRIRERLKKLMNNEQRNE